VITRRAFMASAGASLLTLPLPVLAQQPAKVSRLGFLGQTSASNTADRLEALRAGLRDLGYVEGKNIAIEYRWADGKYDRLPELAAELVRLKVDILLTTGTPGARAAKGATTTIPIVLVVAGDPVAGGIVADLARPGGNVTGSTAFGPELMGKQLELLKGAIPRITQVAILLNADNPVFELDFKAMSPTAKSLKLELQEVKVRAPGDFERAFAAMAKRRIDAVVIQAEGMLNANARALADLAVKHRLPAAGIKEFAEAGGLIGYGVDTVELYRRAAYFVDKILKGAKPADLPVEQATKFELIINIRTAKAIGLTIPQSLLLRADRVIQ
jgi:putative ABC transport system substrate-binding protein